MADSNRTTVITFRGTVGEFLDFLTDWHAGRPLVLDEWELTASIARHPAGKGLRPADPDPPCCLTFATAGVHHSECPATRPADPDPCSPLCDHRCTCPPHEYALAGHRASCPLGGAG